MVALLSLVLVFPVSSQTPVVDVELLGKLVFSTNQQSVVTPVREKEGSLALIRDPGNPSLLDPPLPFLASTNDLSLMIPLEAVK